MKLSPSLRFQVWATFLCYAMFVLFAILGWGLVTSGVLPPGTGDPVKIQTVIAERLATPPWTSGAAILGNNIPSLLALLAGVVTLGLLPLFQIASIGLFIGSDWARQIAWGVPGDLYAACLVPHAIPELAAFALGGSLSVRALVNTIRFLRGGHLLLPEEIRAALWTALLALLVLVFSAVIEALLTPTIARSFLPEGL